MNFAKFLRTPFRKEDLQSLLPMIVSGGRAFDCFAHALREKCPNTEFFWSLFPLFGLNTDQKKLLIWTLSRSDEL